MVFIKKPLPIREIHEKIRYLDEAINLSYFLLFNKIRAVIFPITSTLNISAQPKPVHASWKYSQEGIFSNQAFENLGLNSEETDLLTSLANLGLSNSTHKVYQTVINHIKRCEKEKNISLSLPFNTKKTFSFISYLLFERGVSSKTCDKYLSGVRMYHLTKGHDVPTLRPAIISLILKGKENWEEIQNKMTKTTEDSGNC